MEHTASLSDTRRRNLLWIAVAAMVLVVLAVLALWRQGEQAAPKRSEHILFPGLAHEYRNVARIHVVAKSGTVDLAFRPEKGWVIISHNDFPASFEQVNKTVVGMATLEVLEPKTQRADWLHYLDLDAPPKGNGILITLADDKGRELASVITGKSQDIGDKSGASGLYVRQPNSNQSWLAKSTLEPRSDIAQWYDKNILTLDRNQIRRTDVRPIGSPAYAVARDKPTDADFKLLDLPTGRELSYAGSPDGIGASLVGFTFDDAKPAKDFDFSNAWRITTQTFDGLTVTVEVIKQSPSQECWATVYAQGSTAKSGKEARAIDVKTSGWAFKVPAYKGQLFMTTLESLLKSNAPKAPAAADKDSDDDSDQ